MLIIFIANCSKVINKTYFDHLIAAVGNTQQWESIKNFKNVLQFSTVSKFNLNSILIEEEEF